MASFVFKSILDLQGMNFWISSLQRGYKWKPIDAERLVEDFVNFTKTGKNGQKYCLQPLAVCVKGNTYDVLDGQQRLTTLYLLIKSLFNEEWYSLDFDRDTGKKEVSRTEFLRNIGSKQVNEADLDIDEFHIFKVFDHLKNWLELHPEEIDNLRSLLKNEDAEGRKVCFMWYQVSEKERHDIFETLNNGKIELTNADLIKALLLNDTHKYDISKIATQFNEIEQMLESDNFWYMLQNSLPEYNECRMDLIFNLATGISTNEYKNNNIASFEKFAALESDKELWTQWSKVRDMFINLVDLYEDPYTYHYIGYLTYCGEQNKVRELLKKRREYSLYGFYDFVKTNYIKKTLKQKLTEYSYEQSSARDLRRLFLLHNIETILLSYKNLYGKDTSISTSFEKFPFELLYKQTWDIEHIASQTDNPMEKNTDQEDWVASLKSDEPEIFANQEVKSTLEQYEKSRSYDNFKELYNLVISMIDNSLGDQKVKNKDGIGNLVLLDAKTNRGYHNSLYPRKRRFIIENVSKFYIPPCTRMVFMKFYNKDISIKTNAWTQKDYEGYKREIEEVLSYYFD